MSEYHNIIKEPIITEKSSAMTADGNKFAFWVATAATKPEIKKAVEKLFSVKVVSVNTQRVPGKVKRMGRYAGKRPMRKKAYVTLKKGETIDMLSGV